MASTYFGTEKHLAGKAYRSGPLGDALNDIYEDVERAFSLVEAVIGAIPVFGLPVADITALKAIAAASRTDKQARVVENDGFGRRGIYIFNDGADTTSADSINIVAPDAGSGRWYRIMDLSTGEFLAINKTVGQLDKGKAVAVHPTAGWDKATGRVSIIYADCADHAKKAVGVLSANLAADGTTTILPSYLLSASTFNTGGAAEGAAVWLSTPNGALTTTKPTNSAHFAQEVAKVDTDGASATLRVQIQVPEVFGTAALQDLSVTTGKVAAGAVTFAKMQPVTDSAILARAAAGAGDVSALAIPVNTFPARATADAALLAKPISETGLALVAGANAGAMRTTLGVGTADSPTFTGMTLSAALAMGTARITGLGDPIADQDAATKIYVDSMKQGLRIKETVRVATAAELPANTRSGNVLTASANGALTIDGVAVDNGDRVINKDSAGADAEENGWYDVTDKGSAGTPWILTRSSDADTAAELAEGSFSWVKDGTVNANTRWAVATQPTTLNTDDVLFTQISGAAEVTAGSGLTKTGNTIDVNLEAANPSLQVSADELGIKFDGSGGLQKGAAGTAIKPDTVSAANIQPINLTANGAGLDIAGIVGTGLEADGSANLRIAAAAAGAGLSGGAGSALAVGDAGKGVQVNSDDVQIDAAEIVDNGLMQKAGGGNEHKLQVKADSTTGGNTQPVTVGANGVGLDVSAIVDGTTVEADGSANLRVKDGGIGGAKQALEYAPATLVADTTDKVDSGAGAVNTAFASKYTIPANRLKVGSVVRLKAWGKVTAATVVNLQFTPQLGGDTMGGQTAAIAPEVGDTFLIEAEAVITAIGAAATAKFNSVNKALVGRDAVAELKMLWAVALQTGTNLNTTAGADVQLQVNWQADGGDAGTVALYGMTVEVIN